VTTQSKVKPIETLLLKFVSAFLRGLGQQLRGEVVKTRHPAPAPDYFLPVSVAWAGSAALSAEACNQGSNARASHLERPGVDQVGIVRQRFPANDLTKRFFGVLALTLRSPCLH
jgi:hypothetical protein